MRARREVLPPDQVDPKFLHRIFYVDHFCLLAAAIVAVVNLFPGIFVQMQELLPATWLDMRTSSALTVLFASTSLFLAGESGHKLWQRAGRVFGMLTFALAGTSFLAGFSGLPSAMVQILDRNQVSLRQGSLAFSAGAFLLAGIAILFISSEKPILGYIADGVAFLLSFAVLTLGLEVLFGLAGMPGSPKALLTSTPALCCLILLTLAIIFRRSEYGFLSILWGYGTGSRMARMLAPVLLSVPFLREFARAHLLRAGFLPAQYAGALLASVASILGFVLLLLLARTINRMQERIQTMTLRDELTGLYSVRGFYLLAEQAFRYSARVQEPFGVLFVDMDNLKMINDRLGHSAGSVSLVETAKLLKAHFRETDVIGRVGGDEFVVAGQFDRLDLEMAVERLREAVMRKNEAAEHRFSISLSMGCAVTQDFARESLRNLVKQADEAMYQEKNAKRMAAAAAQRAVTS
jgi:diguanylate cyclase (GGDEF)-like protein